MRLILRCLLIFLVVVLAAAVLGVLVMLTPPGQRWLAERWLTRSAHAAVTLDSVLLGFSRVDATGLRCEFEGGTLTVPTLEAHFPVKPALWDQQWRITKLAAKGWTLDLSHPPAANEQAAPSNNVANATPPPPNAPSLREIAGAVRAMLREMKFPAASSIDGVELEGDVVLSGGATPARMHVVIAGGGLTADHAGEFAIEARGTLPAPRASSRDLGVKGRVEVGVTAERSVGRLSFEGQLWSISMGLPADLIVKAATELGRDESVALEFSRAGRALASARVAFAATGRLTGSWTTNLRAPDLAAWFLNPLPPDLVLAGEGALDSAPSLADLHLTGRAKAASSHWEACDPSLARVGPATLEAEFDLTRRAPALAIDKLSVSFAGTERVAVIAAKQPFQLDPATWAVTTKNPGADWLEVSLQELPAKLLPDLGPGLAFTAGRVSGDLLVRSANGTSTIATPKPLVGTGLAITKAGKIFAEGLDVSLDLRADRTPQRGWRVNTAPLIVSLAGQPALTIEGALSRVSEKDSRLTWQGKWTANLATLAQQPIARDAGWLKGRTASGDFSLTTGYALELKTKFTIAAPEPAPTLTVNLESVADSRGAFSFHAPVRIAVGAGASELTLEGAWVPDKDGVRLDAEVTGVKVAFEHLGALFAARPVGLRDATAALLPPRDPVVMAMNRTRDTQPFWGDVHGAVKFDLFSVTAGAREFGNVTGTLLLDRKSLHLQDGRAALLPPPPPPKKKNSRVDDFPVRNEPQRSPATAEGTITFDAAAPQPYQLNAAATFEPIDAAILFAGSPAETDPPLEGRFAVTGTLSGGGLNRIDLFARSSGQLKFTSKNGIVRLLKTSVAEALSVDSTTSQENLERLSSVVGFVLGVEGGSVTSGKTKLTKAADAVLNFTYRSKEFGYDEMTFTTSRAPDGAIEIDQLDIHASQVRISGTGKILPGAGLSIGQRPLSLELQLGFKGALADNLTTALLLGPDKDPLGYALIREPLSFGGTLQKIDATAWRDRLVDAAKAPPPAKPKKCSPSIPWCGGQSAVVGASTPENACRMRRSTWWLAWCLVAATLRTLAGAESAVALRPGASLSIEFPGMPPTFFAVASGRERPARMTIFLPRNYEPGRKFPVLVFLNGGDGGDAANPGVARALTEERDFVCVSAPLFKVTAPKAPGGQLVMRDEDAKYMLPQFRAMMVKLDATVPNLDSAHWIIGGFSNGAHATQGLIDVSEGEVARRFSAFVFVEGGGRLVHYEQLKGKPYLMVSSSAKSRPRAEQIAASALAAGAQATHIAVDVGGHAFPVSVYPDVRKWLRETALK